MPPEYRVSMQRGIKYLLSIQRKDGGFDSFSSPKQRPFKPLEAYSTTFGPAIILQALAHIPEAEPVRTPLARWLLAQKSPAWSFNYWSSNSLERNTMPYPDDLDDTFCALIGLYNHDNKIISAGALGKIVKLLLIAEEQIGGPYRTWLVPKTAKKHWLDIDIAVNANILYFLRIAAKPLPSLQDFLGQHIAADKFTSRYYPGTFVTKYYLARAYQGPKSEHLLASILNTQRGGHWGTPQRTALSLSSLHSLGEKGSQQTALRYLLGNQESNGSWPAESFCLDPSKQRKRHYSGSPALTTALALEAINCQTYSGGRQQNIDSGNAAKSRAYEKIMSLAMTECDALPGSTLCAYTREAVQRIASLKDGKKIILLPHLFAESLAIANPPQQILEQLGLANLYGWAAYTIYDDQMDGGGDIRMLPVANVCMRKSLKSFLAAYPQNQKWRELVAATFDRIDAANAWETTNCRFIINGQQISISHIPQFGDQLKLADRSSGHLLPIAGILATVQPPAAYETLQQILTALRHYLAARQLSDDILDWQQDIRAGTCSYVVALMLKNLNILPGNQSLSTLINQMQNELTANVLNQISNDILKHTQQANKLLNQSGLIKSPSPITKMIYDLELTARQQLKNRADTQEFLKSYSED